MTTRSLSEVNPRPRHRWLQAVALVSLLLGLLLLDRGFASWRNDPRTMFSVGGSLSSVVSPRKAAERRWAMLCGGGLILLSFGLFTREPV